MISWSHNWLFWFILVGIVFLAVVLSIRALSQKPSFGLEGMEGSRGVALTDLDPWGAVFCHGEIWKAKSVRRIEKGASVVVEGVDGLVLLVRPGKDEEDERRVG